MELDLEEIRKRRLRYIKGATISSSDEIFCYLCKKPKVNEEMSRQKNKQCSKLAGTVRLPSNMAKQFEKSVDTLKFKMNNYNLKDRSQHFRFSKSTISYFFYIFISVS